VTRYRYTATFEVEGHVEADTADTARELAAMDAYENLDNPISVSFVDASVRVVPPLPKEEK
jgi:hypothetical protein